MMRRLVLVILPILSMASLTLCALLASAGRLGPGRPDAPDPPRSPAAEREEHGPTPPNRSWFARQRMSSGEPIPRGALDDALVALQHPVASLALSTAPGTWVFAGPTNTGGRVTSLAVDPHDPFHVWAGAAGGGVLVSSNGGSSWTPVFDDQPLLPVGAIAADLLDSSVVYVGTGEANGAGYSYDGDGFYKSIDGGATWRRTGLADTHRIARIAIDPQLPQRLWVAAAGDVYTPDSNRGIYRSLDGGESWAQMLFIGPTAGAIDVVIDPSNSDRIFAAIWDHHSTPDDWIAGGVNSGIWRTEDGGGTWTRLTNGLPPPSPTVGRIGLALAYSSRQTLYAIYRDDPGRLIGVYKTVDSGQSWLRVDATSGFFKLTLSDFGYYFGQIRVDPTNDARVYVLDVRTFYSNDGGVNWLPLTDLNSGVHVDHHDMLTLPGRLYLATDGGVSRSVNDGVNWGSSSNIPITQFYDLGIDPSNPLVRYGGAQDVGPVRTKTGGLSDWSVAGGSGDGLQCEVDPIDPNRAYCDSQFGSIVRTTNANTFTSAVNGIDPNDRRNWNTPITHDPLTTQRVYTGTYRVYRTTDAAQNWTPISGDLSNGPPPHLSSEPDGENFAHLASVAEGTITTIAVSPADNAVIWAGTDDGNVWVTSNSGASWSQVDVPGRTEWITRVEADPFSSQGAFVTFSGYRDGSPLPRIFRTIDQGASWTDISAGLPDVPLNCVNADPAPAGRGRLFVCSDLGVFVSSNYGATWQELGTGMPRVVVHDLDLVNLTRQLFAGTHARGMYSYALGQLPPADADGDGADNTIDCDSSDPGVFAAPGEVGGLDLQADGVTLSWTSAAATAGAATVHQVLRGAIGGLPVGSGPESCLGSTTSASATDAGMPAPHQAFWYLVRATNSCGTGNYGLTSSGQPRVTATCP